jgi:GMP synthase-like glutamine amidotransferase
MKQAGLQPVTLTTEGKQFLTFAAQKGFYLASQFHVREIAKPASGFIALAEDNECFISESNMVLSFQAHPEIDGVFAKEVLVDDDKTYIERYTSKEIEELIRTCEDPQDGLAILERVVQWVVE